MAHSVSPLRTELDGTPHPIAAFYVQPIPQASKSLPWDSFVVLRNWLVNMRCDFGVEDFLGCSPQVEFPSLTREIFPKAVMLLLLYDPETDLLINMSGGKENALRPE